MIAKKKVPSISGAKQKYPKARDMVLALGESRAHTALRPPVQAALTLLEYNKCFGELSINTLVDDLVKQCELANKGDLSRAEALLTAQAHTLDAIFHNLARRAQHVEHLNLLDSYLRLGLKAQAQCRATLEALAAIKNPQPVAFVRQANIAHGPQQVNNGGVQSSTHARARAEDSGNRPNKVLEHQHGERLDFEATGTAIGANSQMETVGSGHRSQDTRR